MSRLSAGRNKKRRLLAGVLTAVVMIVLFGIVLSAYEKRSQRREEKGEAGRWNEEDGEIEEQDMQLTLNDQVYAYSDQLEAYLLIGTDNSGENPEAVQGFNGNLADFLVLLLVDHDSGKYGFIQIDRDTITDVPILDEQGDEIVAARNLAGDEQTLDISLGLYHFFSLLCLSDKGDSVLISVDDFLCSEFVSLEKVDCGVELEKQEAGLGVLLVGGDYLVKTVIDNLRVLEELGDVLSLGVKGGNRIPGIVLCPDIIQHEQRVDHL